MNQIHALWNAYLQEHSSNTGVLCSTCGGSNAATCPCAKQRWIEQKQQEMGVKFTCDYCLEEVVKVWKRQKGSAVRNICARCMSRE